MLAAESSAESEPATQLVAPVREHRWLDTAEAGRAERRRNQGRLCRTGASVRNEEAAADDQVAR